MPGAADRLEGDVIDPHLADVGIAGDPEVECERGRLRLGREDLLDLRPAADGTQAFFEAPALEHPPRGRCVLVLRDPDSALPLGPGGDQIPELKAHLGAIPDGAIGEAVVMVARYVRF